MNQKKTICLAIVLVLSSLSFLSMPAGLTTVNFNITSSGSISLGSMELNGGVIAYGVTSLSSSDITFVATHFSMLICDFDMDPAVLLGLKTANPELLIFGYSDMTSTATWQSFWSTINTNEKWFLHDTSGNRIILYGSSYVMDITSGWKQYYTSYVNSQLNGSLYGGVFIDNVWNQISDYVSNGFLTDAATGAVLTSSNMNSSAVSGWHNNMISDLSYVESNKVAGKLAIINTDEYLTHDYLNIVDGKMDEGWIGHPTWYDLNTFESASDAIIHINAMARDSATGKIFVADNGATIPTNPDASTLAQIAQNVEYSYAATLLALNGSNAYFTYNSWQSSDGSKGYYQVMNTTLGSPTGSYYQNQSVYIRDFTGGEALFNPSATSYTVTLGKNYYFTNGTMISSVVLNSWSGEILLSQQ